MNSCYNAIHIATYIEILIKSSLMYVASLLKTIHTVAS